MVRGVQHSVCRCVPCPSRTRSVPCPSRTTGLSLP
jgi:hypothetical protein